MLDAPGRTFRDELFEEYKAHRPPMPDDLRAQIAPLIEAIPALGLPLLRIEGVEADDVIGTLAERASRDGLEVVISTGDKDMAQLVNDRITLVNTMFDTKLDRAGVKAKFDVLPEQIVDYLALVGDSSDNIPGVPKVGPKTAAKWLERVRQRRRRSSRTPRASRARSARACATTSRRSSCRASSPPSAATSSFRTRPADLTRKPPDIAALTALYKRLELNSLLRQLTGTARAGAGRSGPGERARKFRRRERAGVPAACACAPVRDDLDGAATGRLDRRRSQSADSSRSTPRRPASTTCRPRSSGCLSASSPARPPTCRSRTTTPARRTSSTGQTTLARLKPILEDAKRRKVGHHLKYDAHVLKCCGIALAGMRYDSMLESYVLNSTATRHDMDSCAKLYLGVDTIKYEDVAGKGAKQITFNQVPVDQAAEYAAEDADVTLQLHRVLHAALEKEPALLRVYEEIEQPLVPVLLGMEHHGVLVDRELLKKQSGELAKRLAELEAEAHGSAGQPFNLDSPKQLQEILFNKQGLPVRQKTRTGQPSTAEDVLEELAERYPLPRIILEYRGLAKLRSTYTEKLPEQIDPKTGRVHTSYHQAVAVTGRLSSSDPNLQNIPIRTAEGRRIRQAFVAPPGHVLLSADYSQIELRIMAHLSGDEGLRRAFAEDGDIHRATAAEVFDVAPDQVTNDQRRAAKAINFGLIYGMSAFGLARQLGIERHAAQDYVGRYFGRYPGVRDYMDAHARERARARLRRDRVRPAAVPARHPLARPQPAAVRGAQRHQRADAGHGGRHHQAGHDPRACLARRIEAAAQLVMQVHDELVLEVAESAIEKVRGKVVEIMCGAARTLGRAQGRHGRRTELGRRPLGLELSLNRPI